MPRFSSSKLVNLFQAIKIGGAQLKRDFDCFIEENGISCHDIDMKKEVEKFKEEMKAGYEKKGSLKMIPTYINFQETTNKGLSAIVIDAGGTNLRIALIELMENSCAEIKYLKKYPMIGTEGEISVAEFFRQLIIYLEPIINQTNKIGFCFSFPTEITPEKDGIVLEMNKGIIINGIGGVKLGERLKEELQLRNYGTNYDVTVINDTVSCLLGGMIIDSMKQYDSFVGFILGTGTNTAFVDPSKQNMIINIESGGYDRIQQNAIDTQLDELSENRGKQKFEKMISGAYLGSLVLLLLKKAVEAEYFSEQFSRTLNPIQILTTEEISLFMEYPYSNYNKLGKLLNSDGDEEDRIVVFKIIDQLLTRSAKLVAINILGIMDYIRLGNVPVLPICISSEGSTFFKFKQLNRKILREVNQYSEYHKKYYCEFIEAKESTLYGTAVAALLD